MCADHPTATELYEIVRRDNPTISRGTLFRVLAQFADSGKIKKLSFADNSARFDAKITPHAHARCLLCGRIFDVSDGDIAGVLGKKNIGEFEIYSAALDFTGCCRNCKDSGIN